MVSVRSEKPICVPPRLSKFSPTLLSDNLSDDETVPVARLIDYGPLSSFQGRSFSASSFHASLLQVIDGVMSLALCPQVVSQAPQHFRSSETQATCEGCFARQSICSVFPFILACPGQYTHRSFRRWMSTIDTFQSSTPTSY